MCRRREWRAWPRPPRDGESVEFGQRHGRAVGTSLIGEVPEHPARGHGTELLVIPDQAHAAAGPDDVVDRGGQLARSGHGCFVDQDQGPRPRSPPPDPRRPGLGSSRPTRLR